MTVLVYFGLFISTALVGQASYSSAKKAIPTIEEPPLWSECQKTMAQLPGKHSAAKTARVCQRVKTLNNCQSVNKQDIYHFDSVSRYRYAKRVLVIGMIHGDEAEGASVARRWMERLVDLRARNSWRIIPIANPDGWRLKTRMNANGVDINRNFPSKDWQRLAHKYWREKKASDPRRNPGRSQASEPETRCLMKHFEEFKPDFIVSIHTPYGVLDFDGPKIAAPRFKWFPWVSLGTFPGSLGRYMWKDKQTPVLTVELKDASLLETIEEVDILQDLAGTAAIRAARKSSPVRKSR